jgi:FAD:protein FMN transferase
MKPWVDVVTLRRMRPLLGTFVEIGLVERPSNARLAEQAFASAYAAIAMIHEALSFHDPHSELSHLNASVGQRMRMSLHALRVLRLARGMTMASKGLFNCTVGGVMVARGRLPDHGGVPGLPLGDASDIEISAGHACLRRPVKIVLDGIAKGYAVDLAVSRLRTSGVKSGWVNAGGDVRAFGDFTLPVLCIVENDRAVQIALRNCAVASSSVVADSGAEYAGEIVSPLSQQPAAGRWSVLSHHAWRADALTKVAALAEPERERLLGALGGRSVVADAAGATAANAA